MLCISSIGCLSSNQEAVIRAEILAIKIFQTESCGEEDGKYNLAMDHSGENKILDLLRLVVLLL